MSSNGKVPRLAIVSTYVPRKCGLATFAQFVGAWFAKAGAHDEPMPRVVALTDADQAYDYPQEVSFEIRADVHADYELAADYLNRAPIDIVNLQHEYGIFGGVAGGWVLDFALRLEKPLLVTLHTVLTEPSPDQRRVLSDLAEVSSGVIALARSAIPTLEEIYGIPKGKVTLIRHGAPDLPFSDPEFFKESLDLTGRRVMLTFGHLGPGKGIEMAIQALAQIVREFPNVVYLVVGATHPELIRQQGESYRNNLIALAKDLGVSDHIRFINKHVSDTELAEYLQAAEIYVSPYSDAAQVSSGPLAFATGAGKAIIATPYVAAKELLASGRGIVTPFKDPAALAENLRTVLSDPLVTVKMRKAAYKFGRSFTWENVGKATREIVSELVEGHRRGFPSSDKPKMSPPTRNWSHLLHLTDNVGVLQHAKHSIADRIHGYCTDDNARAVIAACLEFRMSGCPDAARVARKGMEFVLHAKRPKSKRIRNFMSFERKWLERAGAEDSHGRAVWASGVVAAQGPNDNTRRCAFELFHEIAYWLTSATSPRAWAYGMLGCAAYLDKYPGDLHVKQLGLSLGSQLISLYCRNSADDWNWFENVLTYDNARKSEALLAMAPCDTSGKLRAVGIESLDWLFSVCKDPKTKCISLIGSDGWWGHGRSRAVFDQQPVDAAALVAAASRAYSLTEDSVWLDRMQAAFEWFLGRNILGIPIVDPESGGCRDGLTPIGANRNMGAESSISWMLAQLEMAAAESVLELPRKTKIQTVVKGEAAAKVK